MPHKHMTTDGEVTGPNKEVDGGQHVHATAAGDTAPSEEGIGHSHKLPGLNGETLGPRGK